MVPVAERISRQPWPECHDVLHVGSLVLSVSKYLIRLSNTSAKDHQRARVTRRPHAVHSNRRPCSSQTTRTGFPLIKIFGACLASRHPPWSPYLSRVTAPSANAPMRLSLNASRRSRFSTRRSAGKRLVMAVIQSKARYHGGEINCADSLFELSHQPLYFQTEAKNQNVISAHRSR